MNIIKPINAICITLIIFNTIAAQANDKKSKVDDFKLIELQNIKSLLDAETSLEMEKYKRNSAGLKRKHNATLISQTEYNNESYLIEQIAESAINSLKIKAVADTALLLKEKQAKKISSTTTLIKKEQKNKVVEKFSMAMLEGNKINLNYVHPPIANLINQIKNNANIKKGEFESTAEYEARRSTALKVKYFGESTIEDIFAFSIPIEKGNMYSSGLRYEFNADTNDVNLYIFPTSDYYLQHHIITDKIINSNSVYQGSNAYGATVAINKINISRFGLSFGKISFLDYQRPSKIASSFKIDRNQASQELPMLRALIVMKLNYPYTVDSLSHVEPKRDNPFDITSQEKYLYGNALGIIFYSGLTGEIFNRLPESFGQSPSENKPINLQQN